MNFFEVSGIFRVWRILESVCLDLVSRFGVLRDFESPFGNVLFECRRMVD